MVAKKHKSNANENKNEQFKLLGACQDARITPNWSCRN